MSDNSMRPRGSAASPKSKQKATAKQKAAALREAEAARGRRRRTLLTLGAVGAAMAIGVLVGTQMTGRTADADESAASGSERPPVVPANTSGKDGVVVPYGDENAKGTLTIYADMRCPYCAAVEKQLGPAVSKLVADGTIKVEYRMAAFLDGALGGRGSHTALAALGAAANESPRKFFEYQHVLYANQPPEDQDSFASTAKLVDLAKKVPGLNTATFNKAVKEKTYLPWAQKTGDSFHEYGISGTPTFMVDGKRVTVLDDEGRPVSTKTFVDEVKKAVKG
ncbi:DsbA family protein [Streptomyces formicae]|uniref:Thioredoxin domain-containing protein n=1 Tax=Streptomyces formicae TaxID=1616117 RepID=A0ABY3WR07_9ACTN|nr:thioredoxin domain-containing protein [Streptomyces formicae]UNM12980.1 thioredoxin domain-containing protein [Streptomyces formicae]